MSTPTKTIVEMKIPLWQLIVAAFSVVFSVGGLYVKVSEIGSTLTKIETKNDSRDNQQAMMFNTIIAVQGDNKAQQIQIDANRAEIAEVKSILRNTSQYRVTPK